jgi:hypothetical protein
MMIWQTVLNISNSVLITFVMVGDTRVNGLVSDRAHLSCWGVCFRTIRSNFETYKG